MNEVQKQKEKEDSALWSLAFGLISGFAVSVELIFHMGFFIFIWGYLLILPIQGLGLVLGIIGLRSSKQFLSFIGIVLCLLGLVIILDPFMGNIILSGFGIRGVWGY